MERILGTYQVVGGAMQASVLWLDERDTVFAEPTRGASRTSGWTGARTVAHGATS